MWSLYLICRQLLFKLNMSMLIHHSFSSLFQCFHWIYIIKLKKSNEIKAQELNNDKFYKYGCIIVVVLLSTIKCFASGVWKFLEAWMNHKYVLIKYQRPLTGIYDKSKLKKKEVHTKELQTKKKLRLTTKSKAIL